MALHLLHGSPAAAQGSRPATGCGGRGQPQPGVEGGTGGGCDATGRATGGPAVIAAQLWPDQRILIDL